MSGHGRAWSHGSSQREHGGLLGNCTEQALQVNETQAYESIFHQVAPRLQERCQRCAMDSRMPPEESHQGQFCAQTDSSGHAQAQPPHIRPA